MYIRPKTQHEIVADIAAIGKETLPHEPDRSALLAIAGELAIAGPAEPEIHRTLSQSEQLYTDTGRVTLPAQTTRPLINQADYAANLRAANRNNRQEIIHRRELLQGYGPAEPDEKWGT